MTLQSTVTSKGQLTLPKEIRKALGIKGRAVVNLRFNPSTQVVSLKVNESFTSLAKQTHIKGIDPVKARGIMESSYEGE